MVPSELKINIFVIFSHFAYCLVVTGTSRNDKIVYALRNGFTNLIQLFGYRSVLGTYDSYSSATGVNWSRYLFKFCLTLYTVNNR